MSQKKVEVKPKSEVIATEQEVKHKEDSNLHKRVQTAEGWKRSVRRMRKPSKGVSKG